MAGSNIDAELVERVVQEVLRRLTDLGMAVTSHPDSAGSKEWKVAAKVLTLAELEGKLCGVQRVVVGARTVVTPAVKDELREQGIELVRST